MQYNAVLVILEGTWRKRLYQELELDSLKNRRWHGKLCFYKITKGFLPKYLSMYLQLQSNSIYQARPIAKNTVRQTASGTVNFNYTFSHAALKNGITLAMT